MSKPLRVLVAEDSENDAVLILRELRRGGYEPGSLRVYTASTMSSALDKQEWDVVLSDYVMPGFSGLEVLEMVHRKDPDLPFIIISGQIGEDAAVGAMKAGAHDYIMKDNLKRLVPAIERELAEAVTRKERRKAEAERDRAEVELRALTNRLVQYQEEERRSIARELHDQTGQYLTLIKLLLDKAIKSPPEKAIPILTEVRQQVYEVIQQVRDLSLNLRPSMLDDLGLLPALEWLIERFTARTGLKISFEHDNVKIPCSPEVDTAAYRIIQEVLTNIVRHASASKIEIKIRANSRYLVISVKDNGCGFDMSKLVSSNSTGFSGMRERVRALDGRLKIESATGAGTRITAELPLSNTKGDKAQRN